MTKVRKVTYLHRHTTLVPITDYDVEAKMVCWPLVPITSIIIMVTKNKNSPPPPPSQLSPSTSTMITMEGQLTLGPDHLDVNNEGNELWLKM